jgi:ribosome-associated protein
MIATQVQVSQDTEFLARIAIEGLQDKKGHDIKLLDMRAIENTLLDFIVICSGTSDTHVDALMQGVEESLAKTLTLAPYSKEGLTKREWILLDYIDVVVHIFKKDRRAFYSLEELWGDAIITDFN